MSKVIVVIATYSEADSIGRILYELDSPNWKAIVVDDNSPDGTADIARRHKNAIVNVRPYERGIASAYYHGFQLALNRSPDFIVQMDAGMTHRPCDAFDLVEKAEQTGADLVIGSRFKGDYQFNGARTLISLGAAGLMRLRGARVTDATTGFRCWRTSMLWKVAAMPFRAKGFAFQLETLYRAKEFDAKIQEIAVPYKLTNSSFRPAMLLEALRIYASLGRKELLP